VKRYRLSEPAVADLVALLRSSESSFGTEARIRYRALLTAAFRRIAEDPDGVPTRDRSDLLPDLRSLHSRHSRAGSREASVARPVHVVFYRVVDPALVEVVRVLHNRMESRGHFGA